MKINIGYSTKSIDKALKKIEEYRKQIVNFIPNFFQACADKIIELANNNLDNTDYYADVKEEIKSHWQPIRKEKNSYILENTSEKSVYVEFGVGMVGEVSPHKNAEEAGYEYDVNAHGNKGWSFIVWYDDMIDLPKGSYKFGYNKKNDYFIVRTKGAPSTMFVYQALQDFIDGEMYVDIAKQLLKGL